jgi:hypothetical protein
VDISPLRGLDRSVDGRSGRPCTSRLGAAVSLRGSNRILRFRPQHFRHQSWAQLFCQTSTAHTALLEKIRARSHSNGADARPHRTFVACDKKLAFQFENILPIRCSPTFTVSTAPCSKAWPAFALSIPGRRKSRRRGSRLSERAAASRRMLGGRSSCGLSPAAQPDQHKLCL